MKTTLDCLPCFLRQALHGARLIAPDDEALHRRVLNDWAARIMEMDLDQSPPAQAGGLYGVMMEMAGCDPFEQTKRLANERVMELLPGLAEMVDNHEDPLLAALEISIIGNYIDAGAVPDFDWEKALFEEERTLDARSVAIFREKLSSPCGVLILGDNAGEIGLDTLLVRRLTDMGHEVSYAVRGEPVLNDATMEDAEFVGMTGLCRVTTSGVDTPGTVLSRVRPGFKEEMSRAEVVLSKGQGNFEALYKEWPDIFFAFKVKCRVIEDVTGEPTGTSMFMYMNGNGEPSGG